MATDSEQCNGTSITSSSCSCSSSRPRTYFRQQQEEQHTILRPSGMIALSQSSSSSSVSSNLLLLPPPTDTVQRREVQPAHVVIDHHHRRRHHHHHHHHHDQLRSRLRRRQVLSFCFSRASLSSSLRSSCPIIVMGMISASIAVLFLVVLSSSSFSSSSSSSSLSILSTEAKKPQSTINNSHRTSRSSSKTTNPTTTKRSSSNSSSNRSIQRIKQEYKSIIDDNIAYDWLRQERILPRRRSKKKSKKKKNNNNNKATNSSETVLLENKKNKENEEKEDGSNGSNDVGIDADATEEGSVEHRSDSDANVNDNNSNTNENGYDDDDDDHDVCIGPLTDNIYHWHFSFRGAAGSVYGDGLYHGRFILPRNFPLSPPKVQVWTPNGRFRTHYDICLSASSFHPESWTPQWTIPSLVQALRLHMITSPNEIGGIESSRERTLELAEQSWSWKLRTKYNTNKRHGGVIMIDHDLLLQQGAITKPTDKTTTTTTPVEKSKTDDNTKRNFNGSRVNTSVTCDDDLETNDDEHGRNQPPLPPRKTAQQMQDDRDDSATLRAVVDGEDNPVGIGEENADGANVSTLSARNPNVVAVEKKKSKTTKKKKKLKDRKSTVTSSIGTKGLVEKSKQQDQQVLQSPSPFSMLPAFLRRRPTKLLIRSIIVLLLLYVWFRP